MIIDWPQTESYRILLDGEEFDTQKRIIWSVDTTRGIITYIFKNDHFPYWPSTDWGNIILEQKNG